MKKVQKKLIGKVFGRLKVVKQVEDYISPSGVHLTQWLCLCNCEENKQVIVVRKEAENKYYGEFSYDNSQKIQNTA